MQKQQQIILSVIIVSVVLSAAIAGTTAYLLARRTVSTSKFTTGTLDLDVKSGEVKLQPFVIANMGENANISGTKTWTVTNTGSLPGRLLLRLQNVVNTEGTCNDQEKIAEAGCALDTEGELGAVINLKIDVDSAVDVVSSTLATTNQTKIGTDWMALTPIIINANESKTITAHWAAGENAYGNEVQDDSVSFDMDFRLVQQITGPAPSNL